MKRILAAGLAFALACPQAAMAASAARAVRQAPGVGPVLLSPALSLEPLLTAPQALPALGAAPDLAAPAPPLAAEPAAIPAQVLAADPVAPASEDRIAEQEPRSSPRAALHEKLGALAERTAPAIRTAASPDSPVSSLPGTGRSLEDALLGTRSIAAEVSLEPATVSSAPQPARLARPAPARARLPLGAALAGAAALPLGGWSHLHWAAVAASALAALLAADAFAGGRIAGWVGSLLHGRGPAAPVPAAALPPLFALREGPARRLAGFVEAWTAAPQTGRAALERDAAADAELWREKLLSAFVLERDPARAEEVLGLVRDTGRGRVESAAAAVRPLLEGAARTPGLDRRRLARLAAAFGEPLGPPERARARWLFWGGLWSAAAAGLLVLASAFHQGREDVRARGREAQDAAVNIFFDKDAYVFRDFYKDRRIPEEVLPVLRRWSAQGPRAEKDMEEALAVLRSSPDPKSDNVLQAMFARAELLPLSQAGEEELYGILLERGNETVWEKVRGFLFAHAQDPGSRQKALRMIDLAGARGGDQAFADLFRLLKSPDAELRERVGRALAVALGRGNGAAAMTRLEAAAKSVAGEQDGQSWVLNLLVGRVAAGGWDEDSFARALHLAARMHRSFKPAPVGGPWERASATLGEALAKGGGSDELAYFARSWIDWAAADLIKEASERLPGLERELRERGVLLERPQWAHVNWSDMIRPAHRRVHLETLRQALRARAAALAPEAKKDAAFLKEADALLDGFLAMAPAAKIAPGDRPGDLAASEVNAALLAADVKLDRRQGVIPSRGDLLAALRKAGLSGPAVAPLGERALSQSYSAGELDALRLFLEDYAAAGLASAADPADKAVHLWERGGTLLTAADAVFAARAKHFPEGAPEPPGAAFAEISRDLTAAAGRGDARAVARAEERLLRIWSSERVKDFFLLRLRDAFPSSSPGPVQVRVLGFLARRLSGPEAAKLDVRGAFSVLNEAMSEASRSGRAPEAWAVLAAALREPRSGPLHPALVELIRGQIDQQVSPLLNEYRLELTSAELAAFDKGMSASGAMRYGSLRADLKARHLRDLREAVAAHGGGEKARALRSRAVARVDAVLAAWEAAGLPDGSSLGEQAAEDVRDALNGAAISLKFRFYDLLRQRGLVEARQDAWLERYEARDLNALREFLEEFQDAGLGWDRLGHREPLDWGTRLSLADAVEVVDRAQERHFPGTADRRSIGALLRRLSSSDQAELTRRLDASASDDAMLARLKAGVDAAGRDEGRVQLFAWEYLNRRMAGTWDPALRENEVDSLWRDGFRRLESAGLGDQAWSALERALDARSGKGRFLRELALTKVNDAVNDLVGDLERAFGDAWIQKMMEARLRNGPASHERLQRYTRAQLDELRALVRAQADEARAEPIARLARIGLKAGMAQGDGPAEKAAAAINRELVALDDALWGHGLIRVLRDEKLAPAPQDYSPYVRAETSFYQEYDRARVDALLAFLRDLEKKGYAWDHGGSRMLMGSDRARRLREAIALVEGLRKDLPER